METYTPSWKSLTECFFRNFKAISITFYVTLCLAAIYSFLTPKQYESTMQALVQDSREKPSSAIDVAGSSANQGITTDQIRAHVASEIELLSSDDLVTELVQYRCKLLHLEAPEVGGNKMYAAAKRMRSRLSIKSFRDTNILNISYRDKNPEVAQQILQELQRLYIAKHLQTLRPAGAAVSFA